jgi:hypothetical protein
MTRADLYDGVADLKRKNVGAKLIDHRARAREA